MKTTFSLNINKIATLRNSRGGNIPDLLQVAKDCQQFGAEGITVHPRSDERHIRYADVFELKKIVDTEFNIEGNPTPKFLDLIEKIKPEQVTLVPDADNVLTSNAGWDTVENQSFLKEITNTCKNLGIRVSIFVNPELKMVEGAAKCGADRIELFTGPYADDFAKDKFFAVEKYKLAANEAKKLGLEVNAGHDLNLENLRFFKESIPFLAEVSIGHAVISDALYFGLQTTIKKYLDALR